MVFNSSKSISISVHTQYAASNFVHTQYTVSGCKRLCVKYVQQPSRSNAVMLMVLPHLHILDLHLLLFAFVIFSWMTTCLLN